MKKSDKLVRAVPDYIVAAIKHQIGKAVDDEFERMKKRLDERKAEVVAGVVLFVQRQVGTKLKGENLIITVKLADKNSIL